MTDFVNNTSVVVVLSEIGIEIMRREINRVVRLIRKRCGIFLWHNVRMLCCGQSSDSPAPDYRIAAKSDCLLA